MISGDRIDIRCQLGELATRMGLRTAVEIGTHQGCYADEFLTHFGGRLITVDPYLGSPAPFPTFMPFFVNHRLGREFDKEIAHFVLEHKWGDRVNLWNCTSEEAARSTPNASVGIVYIDGLHDYQNVVLDLNSWWPKVVPGGILSGHDYDHKEPAAAEVIVAVDEFVRDNGLVLHLTHQDPTPSWYIFKP